MSCTSRRSPKPLSRYRPNVELLEIRRPVSDALVSLLATSVFLDSQLRWEELSVHHNTSHSGALVAIVRGEDDPYEASINGTEQAAVEREATDESLHVARTEQKFSRPDALMPPVVWDFPYRPNALTPIKMPRHDREVALSDEMLVDDGGEHVKPMTPILPNATPKSSRLSSGRTSLKSDDISGEPATNRLTATGDVPEIPLTFEENRGQTDPQVRFVARGDGYTLFLTGSGAVMSLRELGASAAVRMDLVGARPEAAVVGRDPLAGRINYYRGSDPSHWHTGIRTFSAVEYHEVYPGVDLVYYSNQGGLEYDFVVAPGADPAPIAVSFAGADRASITPNGDLVLATTAGDIVQPRPVIYQVDAGGNRQPVSGEFLLTNDGAGASPAFEVGFDIEAYDPTRPLIIDPKIQYRTLFGGSLRDEGFAISLTEDGKPTMTGFTESIDFPLQDPWQGSFGGQRDVFVTQLTADGSGLQYSTYLGGGNVDEGRGISIDGQGKAVVTGFTDSTDFPTVNPLQPFSGGLRDAFVTKLNAAGVVTFSTYLGGPGPDEGRAIATGRGGDVGVTGFTASMGSSFPLLNPVQSIFGGGPSDAFVTKYRMRDAGNSLVFSTYLGGIQAENVALNRESGGVAVDKLGFVYATGATQSPNFPLQSPFQGVLLGPQDAFVSKIAPNGVNLAYSTFLGGSGSEEGNGMGIDLGQSMYITGATNSFNFPTENAFQPGLHGTLDAFVTRIAAPGNNLIYSTYLGGTDTVVEDIGFGIAVTPTGSAYVTGRTAALDFPTDNPLQPFFGGGQSDAFVTKFQAAGTVAYSTYLGTGATEFGRGVAWARDISGLNPLCPPGREASSRDDAPCDFAAITGPTDEGDPDGEVFGTRIDECPCTPSGLSAAPRFNGQIALTWTDYCPDYTTKFHIHWWINDGPEEATITIDPPSSPPIVFVHGGLDPANTYHYKVTSENGCCESGYSNEVAKNPLPPPTDTPL